MSTSRWATALLEF